MQIAIQLIALTVEFNVLSVLLLALGVFGLGSLLVGRDESSKRTTTAD